MAQTKAQKIKSDKETIIDMEPVKEVSNKNNYKKNHGLRSLFKRIRPPIRAEIATLITHTINDIEES